jgi:hypothetical protein
MLPKYSRLSAVQKQAGVASKRGRGEGPGVEGGETKQAAIAREPEHQPGVGSSGTQVPHLVITPRIESGFQATVPGTALRPAGVILFRKGSVGCERPSILECGTPCIRLLAVFGGSHARTEAPLSQTHGSRRKPSCPKKADVRQWSCESPRSADNGRSLIGALQTLDGFGSAGCGLV